jgi:ComEC/Rec2-related protein
MFGKQTQAKQRQHRPLLGIFLCFTLGIVLNGQLAIPWIFVLASATLLLSVLTCRKRIATIFLLLFFIFLGAGYSRNYQTVPPNHVNRLSYVYRKIPLTVVGNVVSDVERRPFFRGKKTVFTLEIRQIKTKWGWKKICGTILVNLFQEKDICYGDQLILEGKLHRPFTGSTSLGRGMDQRDAPGQGFSHNQKRNPQPPSGYGLQNLFQDSSFSYRNYLSRKGVTFILSVKKTGPVEVLKRKQGHVLKDLSLRFKHRLSDILKKSLPKEEAGLMQAFLLGDRYDIPKNVYDLFKISGVAHIIAISGFNIGIVATGILFFLKMFPVPRRVKYLCTIVLLIFYAFLTGGQPPVVRATIMAVVFLTSFLLEREQEPLNTLALSAFLILLMNPLNLFDVGFQLSFISVLTILLFYPIFLEFLSKPFSEMKPVSEGQKRPGKPQGIEVIRNWLMKYFLQSLALSLSAYLGVVGLIAYYFRLITPIVIIANLVIVPLASLLIFLGMGLLFTGLLCPFLAFAFANCSSALLNLMVASVVCFAQIPGAYIELRTFPAWGVVLYYTLVSLGTLVMYYLKRITKGNAPKCP